MSYTNFVQLKLSATLASGGTSMTVTSPVAPFVVPSANGSLVLLDVPGQPTKAEVVTYTTVTNNGNGTHTLGGLTRAQEGTTAQSFAIGATVIEALTAGQYAADLAAAGGDKLPLAGGTMTGVLDSSNTTEATSASTGAIKTAGGIGCAKAIWAGGNITAYSDIRLKTDIELIPDALAKVCTLRGVTYTRIDSGDRQTGVIAQEVQAVLPEAVSGDETLGVAYGNMVGLLIEAIKELKAEIDELKGGR